MLRDYPQTTWDHEVAAAARQLIDWGLQEDLEQGRDLTCEAIIPGHAQGSASVVVRAPGVVAGLPVIPLVLAGVERLGVGGSVEWQPLVPDASWGAQGLRVGRLVGSARAILGAERTILNFLGHLSGVASLTRQYVLAIAPHAARLYDTRKTLPGWRRLDKYAVRCGGGHNHRLGLHAAIMFKDNHLALAASHGAGVSHSPAATVRAARKYLQGLPAPASAAMVEIELDRLDELDDVLRAGPDVVLLDNMSTDQLSTAVACRDRVNRSVELEASGGVTLQTIHAIAATGVDRISVGALTHSAPNLDIALDWDT